MGRIRRPAVAKQDMPMTEGEIRQAYSLLKPMTSGTPRLKLLAELNGKTVKEIKDIVGVKDDRAIDKKRMVTLCEQGYNDRQIGEMIGIGEGTIWRWRKEMGILSAYDKAKLEEKKNEQQ